MGHVEGVSRHQSALFAVTLDERVAADNAVRVIDRFVDKLDLLELGFGKVVAAATGRPPYHPGMMLKLFVYGYLNQIRSSRRLERECGRNQELQWLLRDLRPDFKTIANFRRDNAAAWSGVCARFVDFCRRAGLYGGELVAVDGSKFGAVSGKKSVYTAARIRREMAQVEREVAAYRELLEASDASDAPVDEVAEVSAVRAALAALDAHKGKLDGLSAELRGRGGAQVVKGEGDARLMRQAGGGRAVSYNVQTAVDGKHKLIAAHEVTTESNDRRQLYGMAKRAKAALGVKGLTVLADAGYQNGAQGAACEAAGITAVVPRAKLSHPRGDYFSRARFRYDGRRDVYTCPAGEVLRRYRNEAKKQTRHYTTDACGGCGMRSQCTGSRRRSISRPYHESVVERMHRRSVAHPELMRLRASLSEHPFGNIKQMMGGGRFLLRGLDKVKAEAGMCMLAYNLKRVINLMGVETLCARLAEPSPAPA